MEAAADFVAGAAFALADPAADFLGAAAFFTGAAAARPGAFLADRVFEAAAAGLEGDGFLTWAADFFAAATDFLEVATVLDRLAGPAGEPTLCLPSADDRTAPTPPVLPAPARRPGPSRVAAAARRPVAFLAEVMSSFLSGHGAHPPGRAAGGGDHSGPPSDRQSR